GWSATRREGSARAHYSRSAKRDSRGARSPRSGLGPLARLPRAVRRRSQSRACWLDRRNRRQTGRSDAAGENVFRERLRELRSTTGARLRSRRAAAGEPFACAPLCGEHLRQFVEDRAEAVAEEGVGAEEAALRGEIGGVHQILWGDVDIDRDEIADREEPG